MSDAADLLNWSKPGEGSGFEWVPGKAAGTATIIEWLTPIGANWSSYRPLSDTPTLYAEFANVSATEDFYQAAREFANNYGALGGGYQLEFQADDSNEIQIGESLSSWQRESQVMAEAVMLWKLAKDRNTQALSKRVKYLHEERRIRHIYGPSVNDFTGDHIPGDIRFNEVHRPALIVLQNVITKRLAGRVEAYLHPDSSDYEQMSLRTTPTSLIGALWLQLARAVTSGAPPIQCAADDCTVWIIPRRKTKKYHSDECRKRQWEREKR